MLPSPALEPIRDDIVWLYVYNDFEAGPADRAATRIRIRFNVSSWPQLLLVDPYTLEVIGETGRTVESFLQAVRSTRVTAPAGANADEFLAQLRDAEAMAARLEERPSLETAVAGLESADVVVRFRAVEWLARERPEVLVERAAALLDVASDLLRYEVLDAVAAAEGTGATAALRAKLEQLLAEPADSRNPNVLRIHAAKALARCGTAESLSCLRPFAAEGARNNGLTGVAIDTVAAIGQAHADARRPAATILLDCFPDPGESDRERRMATAIARRSHGHLQLLTEHEVEFPAQYDAGSRGSLVESFRSLLEERD